MGKQRELSWFGPRNGWKKMIKGKMYYFGLGGSSGPQDQDGYEKAFVEYIELKDRLKRQALVNNNFQPPKGVGSKGIPDLQYSARNSNDIGIKYIPNLEFSAALTTQDYAERVAKLKAKKGNGTGIEKPGIEGLIESYLAERERLVKIKKISSSSFHSDYHRLARFQKYCKGLGLVELEDVFSFDSLDSFKTVHTDNLAAEEEGAYSVKHTLRTVKALVKYAYKTMKIDVMPRIMDDYASIPLPDPTPCNFTVEQVHTLFNKATDRVKTWILLALNCGYTQVDISTLEHSMINWETGIISRKRHKSGVPSKSKLWELTKDFLKEQMKDSKKHKLVFVTPSGYPLIHELIKEDGKPSKTDSIGRIFARLSKPLKIDLPFRSFRKTGAQVIKDHFSSKPWLFDLYLAHSVLGINKHYVIEKFDELYPATDYLFKYFNFDRVQFDKDRKSIPIELIKYTPEHDAIEV